MHLLTQMHVASWRLKSLLITELGQHQSVCLLYRAADTDKAAAAGPQRAVAAEATLLLPK